jgi:outer membrane protein OmpA-like peptidoglycan-associated protein
MAIESRRKQRKIYSRAANRVETREALRKFTPHSEALTSQVSPAIIAKQILRSKPVKRDDLLSLQRSIGNKAVQRLFRRADRVSRPSNSGAETSSAERFHLVNNSSSWLQRDAEAKDVPQQSATEVDELGFPSAFGVITFDAPPSPGAFHAPIIVNLTRNGNIQVPVPAGSSGTVLIASRYFWRGHLTHTLYQYPQLGMGEVGATARFVVSPEGKFEFAEKLPQISRTGVKDLPFTLNDTGSLNVGNDGSFGSISLNLDMVASTTQTSTGSRTRTANEGRETTGDANVDIGVGKLKVGGYKAGHKDVTGNSDAKTQSNATTTSASTLASEGWGITLKPNVPPPTAAPTWGTFVLFSTNSAVLAADQTSYIETWFLKLPKEVSDGLKSGKYRISLLGQASPTGDSEYNIKLTAGRNQAVVKILKRIEPGVKISEENFTNAGFLLSNNPPKTESAGDKAVHIKIEQNPH